MFYDIHIWLHSHNSANISLNKNKLLLHNMYAIVLTSILSIYTSIVLRVALSIFFYINKNVFSQIFINLVGCTLTVLSVSNINPRKFLKWHWSSLNYIHLMWLYNKPNLYINWINNIHEMTKIVVCIVYTTINDLQNMYYCFFFSSTGLVYIFFKLFIVYW